MTILDRLDLARFQVAECAMGYWRVTSAGYGHTELAAELHRELMDACRRYDEARDNL